MKTVRTEQELKRLLEAGEKDIKVEGEYAKKIIKRARTKKAIKWGGIGMIVLGIAALPFTGGGSIGAVMHGLTVTTGGTTVVLGIGEVAMLLGATTFVASLAILKGYSVDIDSENNTVRIHKKE